MKITLSKTSCESFTRQLAAQLTERIAAGEWRTGDTLPPMKEIARSARVSLNVVRHALDKLKEEGLVQPRRHVGTVVLNRTGTGTKGRVLIIRSDRQYGFYASTLYTATEMRLQESGYETGTLFLPVSEDWSTSVSPLARIRPGQYDLALVHCENGSILSGLNSLKLPYVTFGDNATLGVGSRGRIRFGACDGFTDWLDDRRSRRPKNVLFLHKGYRNSERDIVPDLRQRGIGASYLRIRRLTNELLPSVVEESSMIAMRDYLSRQGELPDTIVALDDYIARGALTALLTAGVNIPDDVRFVTLSVRGNGPVFPGPIIRFELDPLADAKKLVAALAAAMAGRPLPKNAVLRSHYRTNCKRPT